MNSSNYMDLVAVCSSVWQCSRINIPVVRTLMRRPTRLFHSCAWYTTVGRAVFWWTSTSRGLLNRVSCNSAIQRGRRLPESGHSRDWQQVRRKGPDSQRWVSCTRFPRRGELAVKPFVTCRTLCYTIGYAVTIQYVRYTPHKSSNVQSFWQAFSLFLFSKKLLIYQF